MRLVKMLGLAAVAALAAMAFVGAGTASAKMTALCTAAPENISGVLHCKNGTKVDDTKFLVLAVNVGNPKLLAGSSVVECKKSEIDVHLNTLSGTNKDLVLGEALSVTFEENCTITGVPCSVTSVTAAVPFGVHIEYLGSSGTATGLVIFLKPATTLLLKCFLIGDVKCVYAADEDVHGTAANDTGHVTTAAAVSTLDGGLCPASGTQDSLYKLSGHLSGGAGTHSRLWVALL